MNGQNRDDIKPGLEVDIVLKEDQGSGQLTRGIKVRLTSGEVGRVQNIIGA